MTANPLYISFTKIDYARKPPGMPAARRLHEEPGPAHALDVKSTHDGDVWWKYGKPTRSKRPFFYDGEGPRAACGVRVLVAMPLEVDPEDPDTCQNCAELVRSGEAVGRYGGGFKGRRPCGKVLRAEEPEGAVAYECDLKEYHESPHRTFEGATWRLGEEDLTPAPDGFV